MIPEHRSYDRADLAIPGGRLLRLELHRDVDGEPEALTIATGWADPARLDPARLTLPAEILPDLSAALVALDTLTEVNDP